jgi:hypothetical protein
MQHCQQRVQPQLLSCSLAVVSASCALRSCAAHGSTSSKLGQPAGPQFSPRQIDTCMQHHQQRVQPQLLLLQLGGCLRELCIAVL